MGKLSGLKQLESRVNRFSSLHDKKSRYSFTTYRDSNLNLHIRFSEEDERILPIITLRPYQQEVQKGMFLDGKKRFFLVRPRRAGKEVESWSMLVQSAIETPGLYVMFYPTSVAGRDILWNGAMVLPNGDSLPFLDMIPEEIKESQNNQSMILKLTNGSIIRIIGADTKPDKIRGINPRGAVFAEFAFSDPQVYRTLMPVFRQNNGWVILQTTYNGMNHAYQYMKSLSDNEEWFTREDSALTLISPEGNRYVTDEMIDQDRQAGMPEYLIQQEYFSVVTLNEETVYFAVAMNQLIEDGRLTDNLIIQNETLYTAWDLGWNDNTSITFFQLDENDRPVIIHYLENHNKTTEFYANEIKSFAHKKNLVIDTCFLPHDSKKKDMNTGFDTTDYLSDLGFECVTVPRPASKIMAIQSMRQYLYKCKINKQCGRLIECLSNYSKEYDEKKGIFKGAPRHDWASHGVDSFQTMVLAMDGNMVKNCAIDITYYN